MVMRATKIMPSTPPTRPAQDMAMGIVSTPIPGENIIINRVLVLSINVRYFTNISLHQMDDCLYVGNSVAPGFLLWLFILFNREISGPAASHLGGGDCSLKYLVTLQLNVGKYSPPVESLQIRDHALETAGGGCPPSSRPVQLSTFQFLSKLMFGLFQGGTVVLTKM